MSTFSALLILLMLCLAGLIPGMVRTAAALGMLSPRPARVLAVVRPDNGICLRWRRCSGRGHAIPAGLTPWPGACAERTPSGAARTKRQPAVT